MTEQEVNKLIARDDLVARLDRAAAGQVTIISAPAGSGKTSLLRAWSDRPGRARRVALVPVRRGEQDAQVFWLALLNAVRHSPGAAGRAEPSAGTLDFDPRTLADKVFAELAGQRDPLTIMIDDLHVLNSQESLEQLSRLLENLPPNVNAIVATRHDLRLRLHQLRLAGELSEIRAEQLRFTEREAGELLAASGITLSAADAELLCQRTEGWAAGLRLAALSLAGHPDPTRFIAEFSGSERIVAEYLIAEMLERQPEDMQNLLLRTSLLDRINGDLADLLTGSSGSERFLLRLEDANAFVVSLDPERTWFRYHHLFGDLLRLELRRRLPEEVPTLHRRAAGWFIRHGQAADAIRHTQAAGDWPEAARLLADQSFNLTMNGNAQAVRALLQAFPRGAHYPELALVRAGRSLAQGRLAEAAAHLSAAEEHAETTTPDRQRRLGIAITSLKLSLATRRGHLAGVTEQAGFLASPVTGRSDEDIVAGNDLRAVALMNLGTVEASLRLADAERHLREGAVLARRIGRPYLEVRCLAQLGFASRIRSLATTRRLCQEAIELAERHGWGEEWTIAPALVTLAGTMAWTGEFDEAWRWLRRTALALQADAGPDIRLLLHQTTGMLKAARGQNQEALEEFSAAEYLQSQLEDLHATAGQVTGWKLATRARLGMAGDASAALAALSDERAGTGELGNARAVICLAQGDPAGALGAVRDVLDGTAPVIGCATLVEAHLLAGLAHRALGDQCAASQAAERALGLAEADRLILPFAMANSRKLLEALPPHETAHARLLADILDILRGFPATPGEDSAPLAGELSPSELRVLRFLPTNLSRPEIAGELSVSVNTVNTHLRRIYAKLGANDRSEAVNRARELRLLSAARTR
ncbi:MAG TPA: LuxR C-terminal-related transcriptional regulator [Trebonia sp.]|nr:LuxR C-terminal-related transcriptional regulator [Trebonia sp.]